MNRLATNSWKNKHADFKSERFAIDNNNYADSHDQHTKFKRYSNGSDSSIQFGVYSLLSLVSVVSVVVVILYSMFAFRARHRSPYVTTTASSALRPFGRLSHCGNHNSIKALQDRDWVWIGRDQLENRNGHQSKPTGRQDDGQHTKPLLPPTDFDSNTRSHDGKTENCECYSRSKFNLNSTFFLI